jgi:hypothetical protein
VREGVPAMQHVVWAKPGAKAANDRRVALGVHETLGTLLPGQRVISKLDELANVSGPWVAKAPWTAAGRDRAHGDGPPTGERLVHVTRLLDKFGALLFEPWCDRMLDLGVCGTIDKAGAITMHAPHTLRSDARGTFVGIDLAQPALAPREAAELARFVDAAASALHALEYDGPFGIDAFVHRTNEAMLDVYVVLVEDMYVPDEERVAQLHRAFRTHAEAEAAADAGRFRPHPPDEMPMERYQVRQGRLTRDQSNTWQLAIELHDRERLDPARVALDVGAGRALHACEINARHTFGHVAHGLLTRFGTMELGFGEPPEGARVLVEGSAWVR